MMDRRIHGDAVDASAPCGEKEHARRSTCAQLAAALFQSWLMINVGLEQVMPTLVLAALHRRPEEALNLDDNQASWFGSLPYATQPIGSLLSYWIQEHFGRKGCMVLVNIPVFAGWLTLYFATSIWALYAGSVLMGLSCGLCEAPLQSYLGEIGEPHLRSILFTLSTYFNSVGFLLMYVFGYLFDWRTTALICAAVPVISFACITQIPESPTWLISKNRPEDAKNSLIWLRGWVSPDEVHDEYLKLVKYMEYSKKYINRESVSQKSSRTSQSHGKDKPVASEEGGIIKTKFREIADMRVLVPLQLVFIVSLISLTSSLYFLNPYLIGIFVNFECPIDSKLILIVYGMVNLVGTLANMAFVKCIGKRKIAIFSSSMAATSILLLAAYCTFFQGTNMFAGMSWIPVVLLLVNKFCDGFGMQPLCWQLLPEVFTPACRNFACGISSVWRNFMIFVTIKSFLILQTTIQFNGVMYLCGAIAFLGTRYLYLCLPETEGKSSEQIESYFTGNHDQKEKFSLGDAAHESRPSFGALLVKDRFEMSPETEFEIYSRGSSSEENEDEDDDSDSIPSLRVLNTTNRNVFPNMERAGQGFKPRVLNRHHVYQRRKRRSLFTKFRLCSYL